MERKHIQLLAAIGLGVVVFMVNKAYIETRVRASQPGKMVSVVVAKKDLSAGTVLSKDNIQDKEFPEKFVPKAVVPWGDRETHEGQMLTVGVEKGDYILTSYFTEKEVQANDLSRQIDNKEERAITISVDQNNSLARSIVRGDKIDILFTFNIPLTSQRMSVVLLQNVPVIATGSYLASNRELTEDREGRYNSITLKLSIRDAVRLSYAQQMGSIQVLLRNPSDNQVLDLPPLTGLLDLLSVGDREKAEQAVKDAQLTTDMLRGQLDKMFSEQRKQNLPR